MEHTIRFAWVAIALLFLTFLLFGYVSAVGPTAPPTMDPAGGATPVSPQRFTFLPVVVHGSAPPPAPGPLMASPTPTPTATSAPTPVPTPTPAPTEEPYRTILS